MSWIHPLDAGTAAPADVIGGKAHGLVVLRRLGLPVPAGFVVSTEACRAYLRDGRLPAGPAAELDAALGATFGQPAAVSVRSGAAVSMPGMMDTLLDVDTGDVERAVRAVFDSWEAPRARTYRTLHGIPHDLGTAVIVQAMVRGDRDGRSGTGVAFSRDPNTGEDVPYGDVLTGRRGDALVSGRAAPRPLRELADREPAVWARLLDALGRAEAHYRDACHVEFTYESGELWLLQVRPGGLAGRAAVRVAVELADAGTIGRREALARVTPEHLRQARTPRMDAPGVMARGTGACPGVATGRVATTADRAVRMVGPAVLVRPHTSPHDMNGLAAATGIVTAVGGAASHAAVVARTLGRPAVVGVADLEVTGDGARVGGRPVPDGTLITIDGTSGEIALGAAPVTTAEGDPHLRRLLAWADGPGARPSAS